MADATAQGKKKGKLPIILAVVAVLGGGGFFAMKGKSEPKEKPAVELGEVVPVGEFLVNLSGTSYLKTEISLHLAKDAHLDPHAKGGGHGEKADPPAPVRDAIVAVLSSQTVEGVLSAKGKLRLKAALADAVNHAVHSVHAHDEKDGKKGKKDEHDEDEEPEVVDETWDSQTGPVLKVYFTSFAVQE